jgi:hypothetical protein
MSLAAIKRNLQVGVKVVMVRHDWYPTGKLMNVERAVIRVQSNAVQFEGGSWLYFDRKASEYRQTADGFEVCLDANGTFDKVMGYRFLAAREAALPEGTWFRSGSRGYFEASTRAEFERLESSNPEVTHSHLNESKTERYHFLKTYGLDSWMIAVPVE